MRFAEVDEGIWLRRLWPCFRCFGIPHRAKGLAPFVEERAIHGDEQRRGRMSGRIERDAILRAIGIVLRHPSRGASLTLPQIAAVDALTGDDLL